MIISLLLSMVFLFQYFLSPGLNSWYLLVASGIFSCSFSIKWVGSVISRLEDDENMDEES